MLVVITAYALIRISVGSTFIACILTIVGYSVNDTIVIFDRIRENLHGIKKTTPLTTFIMVLLLYILGVASIKEFALPLMVGLLCGAYSSIFIATEIWYVMKLHLGKGKIVKKAEKKAK